MPWPVYTETFARSSSASGTWSSYTVPAGRRAVVKSVSGVNVSSGVARLFARVAGFYVVQRALQAGTDYVWNGTIVAYAGQAIEVTSQDFTAHAAISGYLFAEAARELITGEPEWEFVPWEEAEVLPATTFRGAGPAAA